MLKPLWLVCAISVPFAFSTLQAKPEVWLGDRTGSCIVIVQTDGQETPCPEKLEDMPAKYIPVYVMEE